MKNSIKYMVLSILSLFSFNNVIPHFFYREVPVVVYHEPVVYQRVVYHDPSAAVIAGCAIGTVLGNGITALFSQNSSKKQMHQYIDMFQDLGYDRAQAKVYAKMAVETEGGFQAVVKNIEREKEANRQREAQKQFEQLRHQQKLEKISYEHQLNARDNSKISLNRNSLVLFASLLGFIFSGLLLFGLWAYNRKK